MFNDAFLEPVLGIATKSRNKTPSQAPSPRAESERSDSNCSGLYCLMSVCSIRSSRCSRSARSLAAYADLHENTVLYHRLTQTFSLLLYRRVPYLGGVGGGADCIALPKAPR
ncbi:hypothetical protein EVAR_22731_1 [Eumeta japonica]|uniref:Uncharacterized protein n=1 Tax=Eumeta variegata TaxID=151549 RepID=A0A4C1USS0_EUMVA|nr:hypothetical protein EVAR_22731_1 [Eumeta japonica]